jgi:uncharacterized protein (TIGR02147 family)
MAIDSVNSENELQSEVASEKISSFLRHALEDLQKKNSSLSLRSVAKRLAISPSYLSKIFNGKKRVPPALVAKLGDVLQLDHLLLKDLQILMLEEIEDNTIMPSTGISSRAVLDTASMLEYESLPSKEYWLLEKWYYIAILNLATVRGFKAEPAWIAKRLGIREVSAKEGLSLLIAKNYLERDKEGGCKRSKIKVRFPTQQSHQAVRDYHAAHLRKSQQILEREPSQYPSFNDRLISGISVAGDKRRIETARAMIHDALYKAAEYLADGDCDEVFHLAVQLFPVTKPEGTR